MSKQYHKTLDLHARAVRILKDCGFEVMYVSKQSEALYMGLPGSHHVLRVSAHKMSRHQKHKTINGYQIVTTLTYTSHDKTRPNEMLLSEEAFTEGLYRAVGMYVVRAGIPTRGMEHG